MHQAMSCFLSSVMMQHNNPAEFPFTLSLPPVALILRIPSRPPKDVENHSNHCKDPAVESLPAELSVFLSPAPPDRRTHQERFRPNNVLPT